MEYEAYSSIQQVAFFWRSQILVHSKYLPSDGPYKQD